MVPVTKARRIRHLAAAVVIAAGSAAALDAQTIRVRDGDYWVAPGSAVPLVLSIELDATALETDVPITGFSFGVRHDASRLSLKEDPEKSAVQPSEELLAAMGLASDEDPSGDFFLIDTEIPGQAGFIVAAILGPQDDSISLPGGSVHHLFDVEYTVLEDAAEGPSEVSVTGELGTPPVDLVIDVSGGFPTAFEGSSVEVSVGASFQRGEANSDGKLNITDATHILFYLFQGGDLGTCPVALNVDGSSHSEGGPVAVEDLSEVNLTDAIHLLQYLFLRGPPPAAPFPECGQSSITVAPEAVCRESGSNCQ